MSTHKASKPAAKSPAVGSGQGPAVAVLTAIIVAHMLNDVIQSLVMAVYPLLKDNFRLDFRQIGLITFTFQFTASVLQPLVGYYTDRNPTPYSLVLGMGASLLGLILMAFAPTYAVVLIAAGLTGMGSSRPSSCFPSVSRQSPVSPSPR